MFTKSKSFFLSIAFAISFLSSLTGQTLVRWTGDKSTNWHDSKNWSPEIVPNIATTVQIDPTGVTNFPVITAPAQARTFLIFGGNIRIVFGASLSVSGPPSTYNGFTTSFYVLGGLVQNDGIISIGEFGQPAGSRSLWTSAGSSFDNGITGVINIASSDNIGLVCFGSFNNDGDINIGVPTNLAPSMERGLIHQGGTFTNGANGSISVNRSTEIAILISGGSLNNLGSVEIGDSQPSGERGIFIGSNGTLSNSGMIDIEKVSVNGIENSNIVNNFATIEFNQDMAASELLNNGTFSNINGGEIIFNSTNTTHSLYNFSGASFSNAGTIDIGQSVVSKEGLRNEGNFTNTTLGVIKLDRTVDFGLLNTSVFTNNGSMNLGDLSSTGNIAFINTGTFNSGGSLQINRSPDRAINNNPGGTINGTGGSIKIGNLTNSSDYGIVNNGFFNVNTMTVEVNRINILGIVNNSSGNFRINNNGKVRVGNIALSSPLAVSNQGDFRISGSGANLELNRSSEVAMSNTGSFRNASGGLLEIGNLASVGIIGIDNYGTFTNQSTGSRLIINRASTNAINNVGGTFNNFNGGKIDVGTAGNTCQNAIASNGTFNSGLSSTINLNRISNIGISNEGTFNISGSVNVQSSLSFTTIGVRNTGPFTIEENGDLNIDYTSNSGIRNQSGTFINRGSIILGENAQVGTYGIYSLTNFQNEQGGDIEINRASTSGIYNSSTFANTGLLKIGDEGPSTNTGIENIAGATFNNQPQGSLQLNRCSVSSLDNLGTFGVLTGSFLNIGNTASGGSLGIYNRGTFNHNGTSTVNATPLTAILNEGTFLNSSNIEIGTTISQGLYGIQNKGYFENTNTSCIINIGSKTINGIINETSNGNLIVRGTVTTF